MTPIAPFWFKQRQCKLEPAGSEDAYKVTAPNLGESFLAITPTDGGWRGSLRLRADGPQTETTVAVTPQEAWSRAFELFRTHVLI